MTEDTHLASLTSQIKIVKDRARGVVHRKHTGLYLYGREGTGKTYTVRVGTVGWCHLIVTTPRGLECTLIGLC